MTQEGAFAPKVEAAAPVESLVIRAARREAVPHTPVWFMRQAGRVLPEYRKVREKHDLLAICRQPELCVEVTLQPVKRLGVDAAILFSDIVVPLQGMGVDLDIVENVGPVIRSPIRAQQDVDNMREMVPDRDVGFVLETIRALRGEMQSDKALVGFSGAPFTLATYLVEGRPSRDYQLTKTMMYRHPAMWRSLMERLSAMVVAYLRAQVRAGVQMVQLFDSWIGWLSPRDYEEYVFPYTRQIFHSLKDLGVPLVHFGTGTAGLLELIKAAGPDMVSLDWRISLDTAWERLGPGTAVQGNLDPATLLAPFSVVREQAADVLSRADSRPGHVFSLGHGLLPSTPLDNLVQLVEFVHERSARASSEAPAAGSSKGQSNA
jgi:uroporphyrinogen decarboxylase